MKKIILYIAWMAPASCAFAQNTFKVQTGTTVKSAGSAYIVLRDINLISDGTFQQAAGAGTVKFTGTTDVTLSGSSAFTFDQLSMGKGTGSQLTLQSNIAINSGIDFNGGLLNLGAAVIDLGSSAAITGESETSYPYSAGAGYIQSTVNLNAPTSINPGGLGAIISSSSNMGNTVVRRSFLSATNTNGNGNSILRQYTITPANNSALNATFRFQYLDAELNGLDEASLVFWKSVDNQNWSAQSFSSRNTTSNYVELTGINDFSTWTLSSPMNALPVVFGKITATGRGSSIVVEWEALTELNTRTYNVQRSSDGVTFTTIGTVTAANLLKYSFTDQQPLQGNNFYRIESVDIDNSTKKSSIIKVSTNGASHIAVFPNPVVGQRLVVQFTSMERGIYQLDLFTANGQTVMTRTINHAGGSAAQTLQLPSNVPAGSYLLRIKKDGIMYSQSLLLQ